MCQELFSASGRKRMKQFQRSGCGLPVADYRKLRWMTGLSFLQPAIRIQHSELRNRQSGTLTVLRISFRTASASSLRRIADEYFELTVSRWAKTGITKRLMSSGMQ